jgi:uncharacterized coiled-coil DUF342 family protein
MQQVNDYHRALEELVETQDEIKKDIEDALEKAFKAGRESTGTCANTAWLYYYATEIRGR